METDWDEHWKGFGVLPTSSIYHFLMKRSYAALLNDINLKERPSILELGSGSGKNTLLMAREMKAKKATLVDSNQKALEISKELVSGKGFDTNFIQEDVLDMELDRDFDIVHSGGLVEHFFGEDRKEMFRQHLRHCKEDGYVIIFAPFRGMKYRILKKTSKLLDKWIYDERPLSEEEMRSICDECGFNIVKKDDPSFLHQKGFLLEPRN